jgi:hypothetical protein
MAISVVGVDPSKSFYHSLLPDVKPQKPPNDPTHSTTRRHITRPKALQGIIGVESSGSPGICNFFLPPGFPYLFSRSTTYLPANSEGVSYRPSPDHHVITAKLLAIGTRAATCGLLCPGVLPCPCLGQYAHQEALCRPHQSIIYLPIAPGIPAHSLDALAAIICRLFH